MTAKPDAKMPCVACKGTGNSGQYGMSCAVCHGKGYTQPAAPSGKEPFNEEKIISEYVDAAATEAAGERLSVAEEYLWQLYEGVYGHRKAENIDYMKTAVGGALEIVKAFRARGLYQTDDKLASGSGEGRK